MNRVQRFAITVTSNNPYATNNQLVTQFVIRPVITAACAHRTKSTKNKAAAPAPAFRGLLSPHTLRSNRPKLYAAHLKVCTLLTLG